MTVRAIPLARWNNGSVASSGMPSAQELSALRLHFENCKGCKGRWFVIRCAVDAVHGFVAPRVVTTLVALSSVALIAAAAL